MLAELIKINSAFEVFVLHFRVTQGAVPLFPVSAVQRRCRKGVVGFSLLPGLGRWVPKHTCLDVRRHSPCTALIY